VADIPPEPRRDSRGKKTISSDTGEAKGYLFNWGELGELGGGGNATK